MKKVLIIVCLLTFYVLSCAGTFAIGYVVGINKAEIPPSPVVQPTQAFHLDSDNLWKRVNNWRISNGLTPYVKSPLLCEFAEKRVSDMDNDFSHKSFVKTDSDLIYKSTKYKYLAENLAVDFYSEQETLDTWLKSASHAANLKSNYSDSCIATKGKNSVQLFASY